MVRSEIILVAAPDLGFRHSLSFMLKSVGYNVFVYPHAADVFSSRHMREAACAVIDDEAVDDWKLAPEQFDSFARPVILLVGLSRAIPALPFARPVMKPFLGEPLVKAVRGAINGPTR